MGYSRYGSSGKGLSDSGTRAHAAKLEPGSDEHRDYTTIVGDDGRRIARGSFQIDRQTAESLGYGDSSGGGSSGGGMAAVSPPAPFQFGGGKPQSGGSGFGGGWGEDAIPLGELPAISKYTQALGLFGRLNPLLYVPWNVATHVAGEEKTAAFVTGMDKTVVKPVADVIDYTVVGGLDIVTGGQVSQISEVYDRISDTHTEYVYSATETAGAAETAGGILGFLQGDTVKLGLLAVIALSAMKVMK